MDVILKYSKVKVIFTWQLCSFTFTCHRLEGQKCGGNSRKGSLMLIQAGGSDQRMFEYNWLCVDNVTSVDFFFLAFAVYTIKAAREMNEVVFSSSCLQPESLVVRGVLTGHTSSLVALWRGHLCRTCSVVWSSWPQGQVGEGASFSLRCIWLFSLMFGAKPHQNDLLLPDQCWW